MNVLFLQGIPDNQKVILLSINNPFSFDAGGSCNVYNHIDESNFKKHSLTLNIKQGIGITIQNIDLIFNQISDNDTHSITLSKVASLIQKFNLKCINHPKYISQTTRESIYLKLKKIPQISMPKTIRIQSKTPSDIFLKIQENDLRYPIILREAGAHGGVTTHLVHSNNEIQNLYAIPLDGRDYYLTQYKNCMNEDGLFQKMRLVIINGEAFIRHCISSKEWMVHAQNRVENSENLEIKILESFESFIKPKIDSTIQDIYREIKLEYFGIDCYIDKNMRLTIFEINANMNILIKSKNYTDKYTQKIRDAVSKMIQNKLYNS